ncbi:hypothetical protein [Vulcanisaeta souniana]|uniref:Uncharacterized protein n=1 Tax=Vulcanisaeta souniana JCM 11219 TaxID=1293586 RepID=A0A830EH91_9CREN|nr:hypothetical protein [Vulcanisaeta souniana]BDR91676.1 hypothetical protein Vsou_07690 [Vulcanisaeta souniana JCM 11219]GGI71404.1 hypothetical protein GCM10007112_05270 [Vulcanisaeta souniana JCM 11219]
MSGVTLIGGNWVLSSLNVVPEFRVDEGKVIIRLTGCVEEPIIKVVCHTVNIELSLKTKPEEVKEALRKAYYELLEALDTKIKAARILTHLYRELLNSCKDVIGIEC